MYNVSEMIRAHPLGSNFNVDELSNCIIECFSCAQTCQSCADACLSEENVQEMSKCIRLDLDCADVCLAAGNILSRVSLLSDDLTRDQLRACMTACEVCGNECSNHIQHEHCSICAQACFRCKDACDRMLSSIKAVV